MQAKLIQSNEKGQVALEFIVVFMFASGITFLFVNQAINMTTGYLVHYANFMASRAYLTADKGSNSVQTNYQYAARVAGEVFNGYNLKSFGVNATFNVQAPYPAGSFNHVFTGTTALFKKSLSSMPVVGSGEEATLFSESFLGKEPVRIDCMEMTCHAILGTRDCTSVVQDTDITVFDNGC